MKHLLMPLVILCLIYSPHTTYAYTPKKLDSGKPSVALVLAGGGAKGAAHVGAIRVIEQAGIPIDYVVGTSMGALIGALYSVGYTPDQMDSILKAQDWKVLLSDREDPINETLDRRLRNEQYTITFPFKAGNPGPQKGGFIEGINIGHLFHQLITPYTNDISFDSLPIPFACVAVDIVSGQPHEFHNGSLQQAMRASMAIPAVFTPVRKDSMVLVDGGIMNNYPSDVARKMGADIIIGVDVQASLLDSKQLKGVGNVLQQVIDVATNNDYFEKIDDTDIYIKVDVSGYTAASFSSEAIDTLLIRGEAAAQNCWEDLMELRQRLDLMGRVPFHQRLPKSTVDIHQSQQEEMTEKYSSSSIQKAFAESSVNLSVRYDNIEKVSLLMGLHFKLPTQKEEIYYDIQGRLGNRSFVETRLNWNFKKKYNLCAAYQFQNDETDLYVGRKLYANINYYRHYARLEALFSWKKIYFLTGLSFNHYHWNGLISLSDITSDEMHAFNYYIKGQYNSLDDQWFPTRGLSVYSDYQIITSNLRNYREHTAPRIISARLSHAYSLNRRLTILPSASLRILKHPHNSIFAYQNFLGGIQDALIFEGQQTFAGITRIQVAQNALLTSSLTLRGRISRNQYLLCGGSIACQGKYAETIFDDKASWGARIGYSYRSLIGPLSASAHYSDISKEVGFLVNIGYIF